MIVLFDLSGYVYTAAGSKPPSLGRQTHASVLKLAVWTLWIGLELRLSSSPVGGNPVLDGR